MSAETEEPAATLQALQLAQGPEWCVSEYLCTAGPDSPRYEEQHETMTIAGVVVGSFQYRCEAGRALLYPGALLLGNAGACFECGHDHGVGDRCIAVHVAPGDFDEVATIAAGEGGFRFPAAMLPAGPKTLPNLARLQATAHRGEYLEIEEMVPRFVGAVVATLAGATPATVRPSSRDERRISTVLRHIEDHAGEPLSLVELAGLAAMSKYHFLRCFRRLVGVTPYQYLLSVRLRRAALRLAGSCETVAAIAFDAGFGDLSTFNTRFREVFGLSPTAWRRREGRA